MNVQTVSIDGREQSVSIDCMELNLHHVPWMVSFHDDEDSILVWTRRPHRVVLHGSPNRILVIGELNNLSEPASSQQRSIPLATATDQEVTVRDMSGTESVLSFAQVDFSLDGIPVSLRFDGLAAGILVSSETRTRLAIEFSAANCLRVRAERSVRQTRDSPPDGPGADAGA